MISSYLRSTPGSFLPMFFWLSAFIFTAVFFTVSPAQSNTDFSQWVSKVWPTARANGISRKTFDQAFAGVVPNPEVLDRAKHQPEFVRPVWEYLDRALTPKRIGKGRELLRTYNSTLSKLEKRFGVERHILVAIWGLESAYGTRMGDLDVIQSLSTLAFQGSRRNFGFKQLIAALKILERGDIGFGKFQGSWAGAMGQTQFIPTTYNAYAVDIDGDGRRNVWTSPADALGSTANYLRVSKWKKGAPIVIEVKLPRKFRFKYAGLKKIRPMSKWVTMGIRDKDGKRLKSSSRRAAIIVPAGARGPAFLVFNNFRSILRYNNAVPYALAVSYLAKRLKGKGVIIKAWPLKNLPLNLTQNRELQQLLIDRGHRPGVVDGKVGSKTIKAIKAYQQRKGLIADGYPSSALLDRLRKG